MTKAIALPVMACMLSAACSQAQAQTAPQQQGAMAGMDMPGAKAPASDMQATMNQCAAMRQQMTNGAQMAPGMQKMMQDCDRMDQQMGQANAPYVPPADRTR